MKETLLSLSLLCSALISGAQNIPNIVACFPFSGDASDASGHSHNGVVYGATLTSDRFGHPNSAYMFNGTTDSIVVPNFGSIIANDEVTISFWSKANSVVSQIPFMLAPDNTSDRLAIHVQYNNSGNCAAIFDWGDIAGGGRIVYQPDLASTAWQHYVCIVSASQSKMEMWENGVLIASSTSTSTILNRGRNLHIGGVTYMWHGALDDIMIFNRALTSTEINTLYTTTYGCWVDGISEAEEPEMQLFPNPSTDRNFTLRMHSGNAVLSTMQVCDLSGREIRTENKVNGNSELTFSLPDAPPGIYLVRVISGNSVYVRKLTLQ
jgi:hypothetical protein